MWVTCGRKISGRKGRKKAQKRSEVGDGFVVEDSDSFCPVLVFVLALDLRDLTLKGTRMKRQSWDSSWPVPGQRDRRKQKRPVAEEEKAFSMVQNHETLALDVLDVLDEFHDRIVVEGDFDDLGNCCSESSSPRKNAVVAVAVGASVAVVAVVVFVQRGVATGLVSAVHTSASVAVHTLAARTLVVAASSSAVASASSQTETAVVVVAAAGSSTVVVVVVVHIVVVVVVHLWNRRRLVLCNKFEQ